MLRPLIDCGCLARRLSTKLAAPACLLLLAFAVAAYAAAPDAKRDANKDPKSDSAPSFLRLTRDEQKSPVALETAIVRYRSPGSPDGLSVDLVAALHIAEKSYYDQLNREFTSYDALLYELVASEESKVPKPGASNGNHPLVLFQTGMKDMLGLEYQLKAIDYTQKNMVHADMSPKEFAESMEERGESAMTMFARMIGYAMAQQSQSSDAVSGSQLLLALLDKNRALAMKRVMAEQFSENDGSLAAIEGANGSTLISGRNDVAMKVLEKQIAAGKRRLAIFYGAGHMADMQKQLHNRFALEPVETRWLVAWDLKRTAPPAAAKPTKPAAK